MHRVHGVCIARRGVFILVQKKIATAAALNVMLRALGRERSVVCGAVCASFAVARRDNARPRDARRRTIATQPRTAGLRARLCGAERKVTTFAR